MCHQTHPTISIIPPTFAHVHNKLIFDFCFYQRNNAKKGPVTCVDSMDGCLIAAIGQKVFIHDLAENDLRAVGFVDTQIYTHCSFSFKHFCIIGDIQQGISLLRFQV